MYCCSLLTSFLMILWYERSEHWLVREEVRLASVSSPRSRVRRQGLQLARFPAIQCVGQPNVT